LWTEFHSSESFFSFNQIKYDKLIDLDLSANPAKLLVDVGLSDGTTVCCESRLETVADVAAAAEADEQKNEDGSLAAAELRTQKARVR
jgi:hypothetical protein